jgi:hypothetical protein
MAKDTITLILSGDVPLATFAETMGRFSALVQQLSDEVVGEGEIEWQISHLEGGSATASVRGIYHQAADIERVVRAYGIVGTSLEQNQPIPYSEEVARQAMAITSILDGKVTSVKFVTEDHTASISKPFIEEHEDIDRRYSFGTVTGVIETISLRGQLKFTLYDSLFDRAVACYLDREQQERLRDAWGKQVSVTGWIFRDPDTGRPTAVHGIKGIAILDEVAPGSFERARGVIPWREGDDLPEVVIRRVRDAI